MTAQYHVAGIGNAIVDAIAAVDDAFLLERGIAKGAMTLIDESRAGALYRALPQPQEIAGGSAANTMAGLVSFGGKGLFVGKVKADSLGQRFAGSLTALGVRYATPMAQSGASTACSLIAVTPDGQRSMNTYLGASRELGPADIAESDVAAAQILYVEGYLWDAPSAKAAIQKAIDAAKRAGRSIAFTLSDPFCVGRWREEFLALLADIDILFANEEEAKALFETESFETAQKSLHGWPGVAALTRSEKGCVIAQGEETYALAAAPVERVVDTTGAGDQFAAGFLFGLTHEFDLARAGRLGTLAAAEVISHYGARPETALAGLAASAGFLPSVAQNV